MKIKIEIPKPLLEEMNAVFGEEKAEKIMKRVGFHYHLLVIIVAAGKFKQKYGISLSVVSVVAIVIFVTIFFLTNKL